MRSIPRHRRGTRTNPTHSSRLGRFWTCAWLLVVSSTALADVGRTPGSFAVSPTGAATYTIPIWAPPGPHGLQPHIALVYSSQSGSGAGVMGPGWSVAGLSAISRCNRTYAQDSAGAPVTLTYADAFCLDGKRLRLTSGGGPGTYGQSGTTYQTEIADFSNVTANGTTGNGPTSFAVQGKDGLTYEYGGTVDSRVMGGTTVVQWMLDEVTDRSGNTMAIVWLAPSATLSGATLVASISWTPVSHGSGSYSYTMKFDYNGSNAPASSIVGYVAGNQVVNQDLLLDINIVNNTGPTTIKKYFLTYETAPTTGATRLHQVTECADVTGSNCLSPTTINHQDGSPGMSGTASTIFTGTIFGLRTHFDFNGDGYPDLLWSDGSTIQVAFGSPSGYGLPINAGISSTNLSDLGDLLGTGQDGILANNGGTCYYYTWSSSGISSVSTGVAASTGGVTAGVPSCGFMADVDGDGLPDLVTAQSIVISGTIHELHIQTRRNTSNGGVRLFDLTTNDRAFSTCSCTYRVESPSGSSLMKAWDFNGDGRQDLSVTQGKLLVGGGEQWTYLELLADGTNFTGASIGSVTTTSPPPPVYVDWNNDSCTDVIWNSTLQISGCNGTSPTSVAFPPTILTALDWNGDGRTDVLVQNGSTIGVYLSTGSAVSPTLQATSIPYAVANYFVTDADADGQPDLGVWNAAGGTVSYYLHSGAGVLPDLVSSVVDGYGNSVSPSYVSIAQGSYAKEAGVVYPEKEIQDTTSVVNSVSSTDGIGGTYSTNYLYFGARVDISGRGFEGFETQQIIDNRTNLIRGIRFDTKFPKTGMPNTNNLVDLTSGLSISLGSLTNTDTVLDSTANNQRHFPAVTASSVQSYEFGGPKNGQLITTTTGTYAYDTAGNATTVMRKLTDNDTGSPYAGQQWTTTVSPSITPNTGTWCLNLPTGATTTLSATGVSTITRTVSFTPDYTNCRESQKVTEPGSAYQVTEAYGFDVFGNASSVTVTGSGMASRTATTDWGATGQFPTTVKDPVGYGLGASGYQTVRTFDASLGVLKSEVIQNTAGTVNNTPATTWQYDAFGRPTKQTFADGTARSWFYYDCSVVGCDTSNSKTTVTENTLKTNGSSFSVKTTYLDTLDRPLLTTAPLLSGGYGQSEIQYDNRGNVYRQSAPCASASCTLYWTTYSYDLLNRVTQIQRPINASNSTLETTAFSYQGRTQVLTDPQLNARTVVNDVNGWPRRTQDAYGYTVITGYDAGGAKTSVTDSSGNNLWSGSYSYGIGPFLTSSSDMDLGAWSYTVDALGERTAWTDAKSQSFSATYDALSRPLTRSEPDLFTQWTWGATPSASNVGKLQSVCTGTGTNPTNCTASPGQGENDAYDGKGRLIERSFPSPYGTYPFDWTYDTLTGLASTLTYPWSNTPSLYRLQVQYGYTAHGMLNSVTDISDTPNVVVWQANAGNPAGQITQSTLGNGLVVNRSFDAVTAWMSAVTAAKPSTAAVQNQSYLYDLVGNVTQRQDNIPGVTENFYYDNDYRLDHSALPTTTNLSLHYDAMGNITSRSDVASGATWTYDPTHKHQVTQAGSSAFAYAYDANGNVTSRQGSSITWNSYNYPNQINSGSGGTLEWFIFSYGPDRQVWHQHRSGVEDTFYFGDGLLELVAGLSFQDFRHYIYAGSQLVAVYSRKTNGVLNMTYVLPDHLGSVSGLTNSSGGVAINESFTAFGAARNATTWAGPASSTDLSTAEGLIKEGYTGQSTLGFWSGLNHMKGRVQDAITGRFLSADPIVSDPSNTQNYNRYSYVLNNPLTFTDPSGFANTNSPAVKCRDWCPGQVPFTGSNIPGGSGPAGPQQCFGNCSGAGGMFGGSTGSASTNGAMGGSGGSASLGGGTSSGTLTTTEPTQGSCPSIFVCANAPQDNLVTVPVIGTRPSSVDWQQVANDWWPGYSLGTCIYQSFADGGCGAGRWLMAGIQALPVVAGKLGKAGQIIFKTTHYAPRLTAAGVSVEAAEAYVADSLTAIGGDLEVGATVQNRFTIDGVLLEWRAKIPVPGGPTYVGTIFPVR